MLRRISDYPDIYRIAEELRDARAEQGRGIFEVAECAHIPVRILCYLENGKVTKQQCLHYIRQWTAALGIEAQHYMEWLLISETEA